MLALNSAASGRHDVGIRPWLAATPISTSVTVVILNFFNHTYTFGRQPSTTSTSSR